MNTAARTAKAKRPPMFYTTAEVDVDIDPEDLEAAGWVYVGEDATATTLPVSEWVLLITRNHDDEHDGPMVWCRHDLCMAVTR